MKKLLLMSAISLSLFAGVAMAAKSKDNSATLYIDPASLSYGVKYIAIMTNGSPVIEHCKVAGAPYQCNLQLSSANKVAGAYPTANFNDQNNLCHQQTSSLKPGKNYLQIKYDSAGCHITQ